MRADTKKRKRATQILRETQDRQSLGLSASRRHAKQAVTEGAEDDGAVRCPGRAGQVARQSAHRDRDASVHRDFLENIAVHDADPLAIGREERKADETTEASERVARELVQPSHHQHIQLLKERLPTQIPQ